MFWNKKDDKKLLPDLPPRQFPNLLERSYRDNKIVSNIEEENESSDLPSFPDSPQQRGFSQAVIKEAVQEDLPYPGESNKEDEDMKEWAPSPLRRNLSRDNEPLRLPEPPQVQSFTQLGLPVEQPAKNKDIYVRLDNFYAARKALIDAQDKLKDIDALFRKIRETKMREEQELVAWEKELLNVKSRVNDITLNLFEKVD